MVRIEDGRVDAAVRRRDQNVMQKLVVDEGLQKRKTRTFGGYPVPERRPGARPALYETERAIGRGKAAAHAHGVAKQQGNPAEIERTRREAERASADLEKAKNAEVVHALAKAALKRPMVFR